ncbi:MAG: hypothetical protein R3F55_03615 [Alphaproteobacteria bacterium]
MGEWSDPFGRWGLRRVINASGTMTVLGASRVAPEVIESVAGMLPRFVIMDELQARASRVIAEATGAEAGCVVHCTAAGITLGVAAAIAGDDLAAIEALPDCGGRERRVAVQMGHMITYGATVQQAIALAGAEVVPVGSAALCEVYHLRRALDAGCAAAVYVISHHTVREGELPLDLFIETCADYGVPVIVDMAAEYDMHRAAALGAGVVIHSGHKFLAGLTSGVVAGKRDLVRALYLQHRGIGRTMKVPKEAIVSVMTALELWSKRDAAKARAAEETVLALWEGYLAGLAGIAISRHDDWTGNPVTRLRLHVDGPAAGLHAWELAGRLAARDPAIVVRDDLAEHGLLFLDPCNLDQGEPAMVGDAILEEVRKAREAGDGCRMSWSDVKRRRAVAPLDWPYDGGG